MASMGLGLMGKAGVPRARRLVGALACLALVMPVPAFAQMTGTLLKRRPAQTDVNEPNAARKMSRGFTSCLVDRGAGTVRAYLALPVDSAELNRMNKVLFDRWGDECMGIAEMEVPNNVLRGGLYEALYLKEFSGKAMPDFSAMPAVDYLAPYASGISPRAEQAVALVRFADCVVRARGEDVRSLLNLIPGSTSEGQLFADLTPSFGACLPAETQFEFSKSVLRASLAEAIYRLTEQSVATVSN